jgi:hypothetical protein
LVKANDDPARVEAASAATNTLHYSGKAISAGNESARSVLTRALASSRSKLTWRVFYDVPMDSYLLSVFVVPEMPSAVALK